MVPLELLIQSRNYKGSFDFLAALKGNLELVTALISTKRGLDEKNAAGNTALTIGIFLIYRNTAISVPKNKYFWKHSK